MDAMTELRTVWNGWHAFMGRYRHLVYAIRFCLLPLSGGAESAMEAAVHAPVPEPAAVCLHASPGARASRPQIPVFSHERPGDHQQLKLVANRSITPGMFSPHAFAHGLGSHSKPRTRPAFEKTGAPARPSPGADPLDTAPPHSVFVSASPQSQHGREAARR